MKHERLTSGISIHKRWASSVNNGRLGVGYCILGMEAEFEDIQCEMFSKVSSMLGWEMDWGWDGEGVEVFA